MAEAKVSLTPCLSPWEQEVVSSRRMGRRDSCMVGFMHGRLHSLELVLQSGIRSPQPFPRHGRIGRRTLRVIMLRKEYGFPLELFGERDKPFVVVGGIRPGEGCIRKTRADGLVKMLPLHGKLREVIIRLANSVAKEKIGLVAELESDQLRTSGVHNASGLVASILSRAGPHVQAVVQ